MRAITKSLRFVLSGLLVGALAVVGCSATDDGGGAKASKGRSNNPGGGGAAGGAGGGLPEDIDDPGGDQGGVDEENACAAEKRTGELVPLDIFMMLDRSGSMSGSRWSAVKSALSTFMSSPESAGMGIGLSYYPLPTPEFCVTDADCGLYGPCFLGVCMELNEVCDPSYFAQPAVPIGLLPPWSNEIKKSLDNTSPSGGTPTGPALEGAYLYAKQRAKQLPNHKVVVVLVTDGEPNECNMDNVAIANLAKSALNGNPSISTFVIGVGDDAKGDLDSIAAAGGTDKAVDVSDANAAQEFLDALVKIRGSVACEYQIPAPKDGKQLDFDRVNVTITHEGNTETIGRVAAPSECDPTKGGWYYDNPQNPSRIKLCEATCQRVKSSSQMAPVEVDVLLGCKSTIW